MFEYKDFLQLAIEIVWSNHCFLVWLYLNSLPSMNNELFILKEDHSYFRVTLI